MFKILKKELLLTAILLIVSPLYAEAKTTKFPVIQGSNLEGKKYNVPQDLEGKFKLILVAFKRDQQKVIDTWVPLAKKMNSTNSEFKFYEVPVLSQNLKIIQGFIDGGMRSGIADKSARERTITMYIPKDKFLKDLNISNDNNIHTYLLDDKGVILWQAEGEFNEKYEQELNKFFEKQN